jgi:hypothetical protein
MSVTTNLDTAIPGRSMGFSCSSKKNGVLLYRDCLMRATTRRRPGRSMGFSCLSKKNTAFSCIGTGLMRATTRRRPRALVRLPEALGQVELADDVSANFTGEMKYLCGDMEVEGPFLRIHGVMVAKLFTRLVLELPSFNESLMAVEWCKHVNRTTIFPKLPV